MAFALRTVKAGHRRRQCHAAAARRLPAFSILLLLFLLGLPSAGVSTGTARKVPDALPLIFELNAGQTSPAVRFLSRGAGYTLFLTPAETVLRFVAPPLQNEAAVLRMTL